MLIIGIGNDGREDDGLGWQFLELLEESECVHSIEYRFQLQIEDAELISKVDKVLFVDATKENLKHGFAFNLLEPQMASSFSTHAIPPSHILGLCINLYGNLPDAFMLSISGDRWDLRQGLSEIGKNNLDKAWNYYREKLEK